MKKLQRRQQQNNVNEMNEKKSKKKHTNDPLMNHYIFDEEGENIGKSIILKKKKDFRNFKHFFL